MTDDPASLRRSRSRIALLTSAGTATLRPLFLFKRGNWDCQDSRAALFSTCGRWNRSRTQLSSESAKYRWWSAGGSVGQDGRACAPPARNSIAGSTAGEAFRGRSHAVEPKAIPSEPTNAVNAPWHISRFLFTSNSPGGGRTRITALQKLVLDTGRSEPDTSAITNRRCRSHPATGDSLSAVAEERGQ